MVSLVLTTYNGEKYITEQLDSIRLQTRTPDEVIIRDDGSSDRTIKIVDDYIKEYNLESWMLISEQNNVGWKRNFYEAIVLAQGDYIFLSDQDDIWHKDKVESTVAVMKNRPEIELLASGYHSFYENGANHLSNQGDRKNDGTVEQICFDKNCLNIFHPGCTFCFTKSLQKRFREYWFESSPHDAMLWYLAVQNDSLYIFNKVLMEYRRHKESATDHVGHYTVEKQLEIYKRHTKVLDMLIEMNQGKHDDRIHLLQNMKEWYHYRIMLIEKKNFIYAIRLLSKINYYSKPRYLLIDIKLALFG
ncbi:glycosyltransferase [Ruminococcus sp. OM08-7]|nr:glycosyltransferase [Ruminococcus sp. OM08-7]